MPHATIHNHVPGNLRIHVRPGCSSCQSSAVSLKVFDALGREVAVLVNERKAAGSYEVNFDAAVLASGVYIYRPQAGDFVGTRKMVLTK
jgi:hypothetical protein